MNTVTLRLNNSVLGWMLVPSYQHPSAEAYSWLSDLYGESYEKMKPSERAFMRGEPIEKVIAHLKDVCKQIGMSVSFCGGNRTLRLWQRHPLVPVKPEEISVDLKWSCWTADESVWNEFAPGVWDRMQKAFTGESGPVTIHTGPKKEIRYGSVTIEKSAVYGYFCTNWDDCEQLACVAGTKCDDAFRMSVPYSSHMNEPGVDFDFPKFKARKFSSLMQKIDKCESELILLDERKWNEFLDCFRESNELSAM